MTDIRVLSENDILDIAHTHSFFREKKEAWDRTHDGPTPITESMTFHEQCIYGWYNRPLMSDEEYLDKILHIVKLDHPILTVDQVAAVYQIRAVYEFLPPDRHGQYILPNAGTVRLQVSASKKLIAQGRTSETLLLPLSQEDLQAFHGEGAVFRRLHWYTLEDALKHPLGRWRQHAPRIELTSTTGTSRRTVRSYLPEGSAIDPETGLVYALDARETPEFYRLYGTDKLVNAEDYPYALQNIADMFDVTDRSVFRYMKYNILEGVKTTLGWRFTQAAVDECKVKVVAYNEAVHGNKRRLQEVPS